MGPQRDHGHALVSKYLQLVTLVSKYLPRANIYELTWIVYSSHFVVQNRRICWMNLLIFENFGRTSTRPWTPGVMMLWRQTQRIQWIISAGQLIPRQGPAILLPSGGGSRVSVFICLLWCELGTSSIIFNDNGAHQPKRLLFVMKPLTANSIYA